MAEQARWSVLERVFHDALERDPGERAEYVRTACGSDEDLRRRVESLLRHDEPTAPAESSPEPSGPRIGPYQIISKLGEGGMGEVYLARDSRLDRQVALKILSRRFATDPDRKRRFLREAKAASALNHPNIVTVYDVGTDGKLDYLVMEYVAGKPLDRLIPHDGLKLKEALKYATQIAEALTAAHAAGIIHRDLKPANVLITESGVAKVVDFGIAKQARTASDAGTLTQEGVIVGTVAYMSPEQAEGKPVDARSDIFSFGSLLYEMVTGRRAFQRDTAAATLAAVIHEEPQPISALSDDVPEELEGVIGRCLRKDPAERFQTIAEVGTALERLPAILGRKPSTILRRQEPKKRRPRLLWAAGAAVLLALVATGVWFVRSKPAAPKAELTAVPLTTYPGRETSPSLSPDGTEVAFSWCKDVGQPNGCSIYIKEIGVEPPSRLTDAAAADCCPAWSPDGRFIAFIRHVSATRIAVVIVPQRGGRERVLTESDVSKASIAAPGSDSNAHFATPGSDSNAYLAWSPDSTRLAIPQAEKDVWALSLLSVQTGEKRTLTRPGAGVMADLAPAFSPDGRWLVFSRRWNDMVSSDLYLLKLGDAYTPTGEPKKLALSNPMNLGGAWLAEGDEIVFSSGGSNNFGLWRMPVSNPARARMLPFASSGSAPTVARQASRLAFAVDRSAQNIWRIRLDSAGRATKPPSPFIVATRWSGYPAYSPDGKRIAFGSGRSGTPEIWVCDSDGSNPVQLTSIGDANILAPKWSWDGRNIAFWIDWTDAPGVYVIDANGGSPGRLKTTPRGGKWPYFSHDGKWLYFSGVAEYSGIWKAPLSGGNPVRLTRNGEDHPQATPDGKFVYYMKGWPYEVSVWRMPAEGGEGTKVIDSVNPYGQWTVGERGIYYFTATDTRGNSDIRLYEYATRKNRKISTVERSVYVSIAASPDGRTIVYPQRDEVGSDLMLVENFR